MKMHSYLEVQTNGKPDPKTKSDVISKSISVPLKES